MRPDANFALIFGFLASDFPIVHVRTNRINMVVIGYFYEHIQINLILGIIFHFPLEAI